MNKPWRWLSKLATALLLILLGLAWVVFAPTQFGGQAAYVIVNGNSMEPLYHRGDLVIIRAQPDYQVGDIVTYHHPQIGPVIHRIIGRDVEHFIFKGDHNDFIDPYRPVRADLIGKSWIYLPAVGSVLSLLRTPQNMAILAAVAGVIIMAPGISIGKQPKARKRGRAQAGQLAAPSQRRDNEAAFMALFVLACASIALAAFAFTRPITQDVSDEITYQHTGIFRYSAAAPAGLYDTNTIQTGEPLFPQLTSDATFTFDYQLVADSVADLHGSYRLLAELSAANGWQRTIELQPITAFNGGTFTASGVLHFAQVRALIDHFEQQTTLERQQYTLAIVPELAIEGTLDTQALRGVFAPQLKFRLDQTQMQLVDAGGSDKNPLKPAAPGLIKYTQVEPNVISLLFLKLEVPLARELALGVLAIALSGLLVLGLLRLRAGRPDQAARIRAKYGALLIDSIGAEPQPELCVVELAVIDDLAKLANKNGQMIVHEQSDSTHRYRIHDDGICYRYQFSDVERAVLAPLQPMPQMVTAGAPAAWQAIFLEALREKGTVSEACRVANIEIIVAYQERIYDPTFAQAWAEARTELRQALSREGDLL
ncbi:MAG: signal peptidase I [Roseiflexaceae bacterium]